jgi:large subunit ribosomal protein L23
VEEVANSTLPQRMKGPKLEPYQIIIRPLITEKGTHQSQHRHAYPFEVNPWSTKTEIKAAAELLFGIRVSKVRTQNRPGKQRRFRFKMGRLSNWKKAIIILHPDSPPIEFF